MAQAKYERLGNIYSRIKGLIKGGALDYKNRPLWYDIYEKYPPLNPPAATSADIPTLIYPEDYLRAYYYDNIGQNGIIDLKSKTKTTSQKFVEKYCEILKNNGDDETIDIYELAKDALEKSGVIKDKKLFNKNIE